jgi:hypothetical protein
MVLCVYLRTGTDLFLKTGTDLFFTGPSEKTRKYVCPGFPEAISACRQDFGDPDNLLLIDFHWQDEQFSV